MVDMAATARPHVALPLITVGRLGYPELAERIVEEGTADFVALGRPLLADPDFAHKAQRGRAARSFPASAATSACTACTWASPSAAQ